MSPDARARLDTIDIRPRAHTIEIVTAGSMAPAEAAGGAVDGDKLLDFLLYLELRLTD